MEEDSSSDCHPLGKPIPVLIMNATPNPNADGGVSAGAIRRSTMASAEYFAKLNGHTNPPTTTRLPHQDPSDSLTVDRTVWNEPGKAEVVLFSIKGGGQGLPVKIAPIPWGGMTKDIDGPVEIWDFFSRQPPLR